MIHLKSHNKINNNTPCWNARVHCLSWSDGFIWFWLIKTPPEGLPSKIRGMYKLKDDYNISYGAYRAKGRIKGFAAKVRKGKNGVWSVMA